MVPPARRIRNDRRIVGFLRRRRGRHATTRWPFLAIDCCMHWAQWKCRTRVAGRGDYMKGVETSRWAVISPSPDPRARCVGTLVSQSGLARACQSRLALCGFPPSAASLIHRFFSLLLSITSPPSPSVRPATLTSTPTKLLCVLCHTTIRREVKRKRGFRTGIVVQLVS